MRKEHEELRVLEVNKALFCILYVYIGVDFI
jgi:hypothetical protein